MYLDVLGQFPGSAWLAHLGLNAIDTTVWLLILVGMTDLLGTTFLLFKFMQECKNARTRYGQLQDFATSPVILEIAICFSVAMPVAEAALFTGFAHSLWSYNRENWQWDWQVQQPLSNFCWPFSPPLKTILSIEQVIFATYFYFDPLCGKISLSHLDSMKPSKLLCE